jgi:hypothetical protein
MDLQQAKVLIKKINSLFKGMEEGDHTLSAIERDLMLSYIRQLYEEFINMRGDIPLAKTPTRSMEGESSKPPFEVIAPKAPEQPKKPKIIEVPESLKNLAPEPPPKPKEVEKVAPRPEPTPKVEPKPVKPSQSPPSGKEGEYNVLFEFKAAKELSEKLSERRVDDLSKAMAINDRLLFMNELFGKDAEALNESLKVLNKYENLQEAKGLLINLAERYDWLDEEKLPTAQGFIKLVRRKYI